MSWAKLARDAFRAVEVEAWVFTRRRAFFWVVFDTSSFRHFLATWAGAADVSDAEAPHVLAHTYVRVQIRCDVT